MLEIKFYIASRRYFIKRWSNTIAHKAYRVKSFLWCRWMEFKYFMQGRNLQAEIDADIEREVTFDWE